MVICSIEIIPAMIKNFIAWVFLILPLMGHAQMDHGPDWQISYYGDLALHPGVKIGYEVPFKNWIKTKAQKEGSDIRKYKYFNGGIDLAYYWHPLSHHGVILSPNINYQRIKENEHYF